MRVKQHPYLSPAAMELRQRDGIPPWSVHPCEVDALGVLTPETAGAPFLAEWQHAVELRRALEQGARRGSSRPIL